MLTKLSRRWGGKAREQNWFAVAIDFIIVVAGVFLAIQAANWNETRKERAEERRYSAQIVEDLRVDQRQLQYAQERADTFDTAAENTLRAMHAGLSPDVTPGRFAVQIHHAGYLYIPRPSRRTYDELISTGNLRLLRNGAAKSGIANYYATFDVLRQWDVLLRLQQDRYGAATAGVLPRPVLQDAVGFREPKLTAADAAMYQAHVWLRPQAADLDAADLTADPRGQSRHRRLPLARVERGRVDARNDVDGAGRVEQAHRGDSRAFRREPRGGALRRTAG